MTLSRPPGYPLLGHLPHFLRDRLGFLLRCARDYGGVVQLSIGRRTYLLTEPDDIRHVLITNSGNYEKTRRLTSWRGRRLSGEGLLTSTGPAAIRQRRLLQPAFHRRVVESFADIITLGARRMVADWDAGAELDIDSELMQLTQGNIMRILFGRDFMDEGEEFAKAITTRRHYIEYVYRSLFPLPEYVPVRIMREYRSAAKRLDAILDREIRSRRGTTDSNDMLSVLIRLEYEDGTRMTDEQVRDEARTLSLTGYETIGAALSWTCYLLARHPEVEARLVAEVVEVLGDRPPTAADVRKLPFVGMVLSESLRLYPSNWIFVRMADREDRLPSGVTVPAGAKLYLCQYATHRDPRYFPEPERFDPERFDGTSTQDRPQFAYFPFGGGPRVCIGQMYARMEGVLVLASLFRDFRLRLMPGHPVIPEPAVALRPKNGIRVRVERRR